MENALPEDIGRSESKSGSVFVDLLAQPGHRARRKIPRGAGTYSRSIGLATVKFFLQNNLFISINGTQNNIENKSLHTFNKFGHCEKLK